MRPSLFPRHPAADLRYVVDSAAQSGLALMALVSLVAMMNASTRLGVILRKQGGAGSLSDLPESVAAPGA